MPWGQDACCLARGTLVLFCQYSCLFSGECCVVWFRSTDNNKAQQQERSSSLLQVSASARSAFMSDTRETGTFLRMMSVLKGLRQIPILCTGNTDRLHEVRSSKPKILRTPYVNGSLAWLAYSEIEYGYVCHPLSASQQYASKLARKGRKRSQMGFTTLRRAKTLKG